MLIEEAEELQQQRGMPAFLAAQPTQTDRCTPTEAAPVASKHFLGMWPSTG